MVHSVILEYLPTYPQDPEKIYPNLISDLTAICLQAFQSAKPDHFLNELIYYEHYTPILQLNLANLHLSHPPNLCIHPQIQVHFRRIRTTQLPGLGSTLEARHYAELAEDFLYQLRCSEL